MKKRIDTVEDDFWTERIELFTTQFPSYYTKPQKVWGRFHTSEETYIGTASEIIPLQHKKGKSMYVMMHPYVLEPKLTFTVGLYNKSKHYADQESAIGEVIGSNHEGFQDVQVGNAQAWYYHAEKTIVLWECFFNERFRQHSLPIDKSMQNLWQSFERYLVKKFPKATNLATHQLVWAVRVQ